MYLGSVLAKLWQFLRNLSLSTVRSGFFSPVAGEIEAHLVGSNVSFAHPNASQHLHVEGKRLLANGGRVAELSAVRVPPYRRAPSLADKPGGRLCRR